MGYAPSQIVSSRRKPMDIMRADQARAKALKSISQKEQSLRQEKVGEEMLMVSKAITKAIQEQKLEVSIYNQSLMKETIDVLEDRGYKVEYKQGGINEWDTVISWK